MGKGIYVLVRVRGTYLYDVRVAQTEETGQLGQTQLPRGAVGEYEQLVVLALRYGQYEVCL